MALELIHVRARLKASAFGFGRVAAEPPTPRAMTLNAIEENIRNAAMIFFIDFDG